MISEDELQLLLTLNGNNRLPHLEEEIFARNNLMTLYLHRLCHKLDLYELYDSNACLVYLYSTLKLGSTWLAAEHILLSDGIFAYYYVIELKGRWPEAESCMRDSMPNGKWREYCAIHSLQY